jgi:TatD DNase family protein
LPVIIHTREADEDTIEILRSEWEGAGLGGIMHCFGGSWELAEAAMKIGFLISFAGNITFKKATPLREIAARTPLSQTLIETDCPYLTPEPYRGRRNEPARVVEVARCLANIHERSLEDVARITTENFQNLFRLQYC